MKITNENINDIFKANKKNHEVVQGLGYELIEHIFCDSSGLGADDEPAKTPSQLTEHIKELLKKDNPIHVYITDTGQFQCYLSAYRKMSKNETKRTEAKQLEGNTFLIVEGDKRTIFLYNTPIITEEDGALTLDHGGYETKLTKDRMSKYIGKAMYQKDFKWYIDNGGEHIPYENGMTIAGRLNI